MALLAALASRKTLAAAAREIPRATWIALVGVGATHAALALLWIPGGPIEPNNHGYDRYTTIRDATLFSAYEGEQVHGGGWFALIRPVYLLFGGAVEPTTLNVGIAALGILALAGWDGLLKYGVLWLLPALTVLQAILRLRAIAEHGAPAGYDSPLTAARTHLTGPLTRAVLFPHHVGYHIEHHLYPAVPHYRLPALHAALSEQGMLDGAQVGAFGETWRRVYAERADRSVRAA